MGKDTGKIYLIPSRKTPGNLPLEVLISINVTFCLLSF